MQADGAIRRRAPNRAVPIIVLLAGALAVGLAIASGLASTASAPSLDLQAEHVQVPAVQVQDDKAVRESGSNETKAVAPIVEVNRTYTGGNRPGLTVEQARAARDAAAADYRCPGTKECE